VCVCVTEDPEYDGGSAVVEYLVTMNSDVSGTRDVYRGHDTQCTVASLLPGRLYAFQVKANNRAGVRSTRFRFGKIISCDLCNRWWNFES